MATNSRASVLRWPAVPLRRKMESATYGAFLGGVFRSDAAAFGISRAEARGLDPAATLILETSYGVLCDDSGSGRRMQLANMPVGVFLGAGGSVASSNSGSPAAASAVSPDGLSPHSATAGALSVLSGRLSYALGLTGPCLTTDTACSSSLVAAHLAASALRLEDCPRAVVTGAGLLTAGVSVTFSAAGMLSAFGRCHTFDRRADGYCRGEGCGAFLVLSESHDAVVLRSAVQQDGPSASLTAPNGSSQGRLIEAVRRALSNDTGVPALEAHGTGTALGDPIEVCFVL